MTGSDRRLLVFLPGLDGTGKLLFRQPGLHQKYEVACVAYPQRTPVGYADLADLGIREIERAGRGPATVLAESFGGAVALTLALRRPDLVERLVLVNTFAWYPARLHITLSALVSRFFPGSRSAMPWTRPLRGWAFFSPAVPSADREAWWQQTADIPLSGYAYRLRLVHGLDLRRSLDRIRIPTLVVAAPDDRVVPCRAGRELARLLPCARLRMPRVGHSALVHPRLDLAALLDEPGIFPDPRDRESSAP